MTVPIANASVSILTAPSTGQPKYHLMELSPELVGFFEAESSSTSGQKHARDGDKVVSDVFRESTRPRLCIKGRQADEAVLCTDTKSYLIRQVTQSNSLLLCTLDSAKVPSNPEITVRSNVVDTLELIPIAARVGSLTTLLKDSTYAGDEDDSEKDDEDLRWYTMQQVASVTQASPAELQAAFREHRIIELNGRIRMIEPRYLTECLHTLIAHIESLALSLDHILIAPAVAALVNGQDISRKVARAFLCEWFGSKAPGDGEGAERQDEAISLNGDAVLKQLGVYLLESRAASLPIDLEEFINQWKAAAGSTLGESADLALLKGSFLQFPAPPSQPSKLNPPSIQYFPSSALSLDTTVRFKQLFTARPQWTADALKSYLREVAVDTKRQDALLLKFARASTLQIPVHETKQERRARMMAGNQSAPTQPLQLYSARLRY